MTKPNANPQRCNLNAQIYILPKKSEIFLIRIEKFFD